MQPFESHIPYLLQFFQDFELSGMDWIHFDWNSKLTLVNFRSDSLGIFSTTTMNTIDINSETCTTIETSSTDCHLDTNPSTSHLGDVSYY